MAVLIESLLKKKIDPVRLLKMIILHDLVEAEARDISALDVLRNPEIKIQKLDKERQAIENLRTALNEPTGRRFMICSMNLKTKKHMKRK